VAFNVGGTWKLSKHLNLLFSGGRDIVGDTHAMGLRWLAVSDKVNVGPNLLCTTHACKKAISSCIDFS
jgi:hypothetical protein